MRTFALLLFVSCGSFARGSNSLPFTDEDEISNPYGSCPMVKRTGSGWGRTWDFQTPPCGYPSVTCLQEQHMECGPPFPNTDLYSGEETVIATYSLDDEDTCGAPGQFECPLTCFACAGLCQAQAKNASDPGNFGDPTLKGCNLWVFCTNPEGCANAGRTVPGFSCTLARVPLDNPAIQKELVASGVYTDDPAVAPEELVVKGSSGKGSDFVSGLCNVRQTCLNNATIECDAGCGTEDSCGTCGGYPFSCAGPCCPSCPC